MQIQTNLLLLHFLFNISFHCFHVYKDNTYFKNLPSRNLLYLYSSQSRQWTYRASKKKEAPINMIMIYFWVKKFHISWCEFMLHLDSVIGTAEDPSLRFFAMTHMKNQILENVFRGLFLDSWQNLSLPPNCQDILQSTSYQIWGFLPSC